MEGRLRHAVDVGRVVLEDHVVRLVRGLETEEAASVCSAHRPAEQIKYLPEVDDRARVDVAASLTVAESVTVDLGVPRALLRRRDGDVGLRVVARDGVRVVGRGKAVGLERGLPPLRLALSVTGPVDEVLVHDDLAESHRLLREVLAEVGDEHLALVLAAAATGSRMRRGA